MFDWLFDKRVRVRVRFVTTWYNYHINKADICCRILGFLALYEGVAKDRKLYMSESHVTKRLYDDCNFTCGGHSEPAEVSDGNDIEKDAWIEFNCWESTFKKIRKINPVHLVFFDAKIVGEEIL